MKKYIPLAFTIMATVVFILGSGTAKAQEKKEVRKTIIINDRDTIINGKKLSEASPAERKALLKELKDKDKSLKDRKIMRKEKDGKEETEIIIRQGDKEPRVLRWRSEDDKDGHTRVFKLNSDSLLVAFDGDSLGKNFRFNFDMDGLDSNMHNRIITINPRVRGLQGMVDGSHPRILFDEDRLFDRVGERRKNSQTFNYVSTDKDGVSSRMSIRISEASEETLKKLKLTEDEASLEVSDLTLSPNFSNGKLNLTFNLSEKGSAEVKIMDSNMKELFADRTASVNGTYFKQISLPKNGVYYIQISQGGKTFVRKMVKE